MPAKIYDTGIQFHLGTYSHLYHLVVAMQNGKISSVDKQIVVSPNTRRPSLSHCSGTSPLNG